MIVKFKILKYLNLMIKTLIIKRKMKLMLILTLKILILKKQNKNYFLKNM